ncbi:MAG: type II toxin-antitoxin system RelE/ParE family toxin [Syntrophales bacterium]
MAWDVEYTDEFEAWWGGLEEEEQIDIDAVVGLLEEKGPHLPYPYSSEVKGIKCGSMRELRVQHKGKPYRILYVFDPRRAAILLIGGRKTGGSRWYEKFILLAEKIYAQHLKDLKNEQGGSS